jgi:hypothetical protein
MNDRSLTQIARDEWNLPLLHPSEWTAALVAAAQNLTERVGLLYEPARLRFLGKACR